MMMTTTTATTKEAGWTLILRRSPWSCLRTTKMLQAIAIRTLQEEMMPFQVPQEETMLKMVMMI
jgi:hypothetical protein